MVRAQSLLLGGLLACGLLVLYTLYPPLILLDPGEYDRSTLSVTAANGTELATVEVRIAETRDQRRIGLSRTDSLANGTGMLFVHSEVGTHSYVMRNMSFGIDIVFLDPEGTITEIHSADPPPADDPPYRGTGQYVLEVPRGWMAAVGASEGDTVEIPPSVSGETDR